MQLLKLFLSMSLLLFAFTLSGCQGNNSDPVDAQGSEVVPPSGTLPPSIPDTNVTDVTIILPTSSAVLTTNNQVVTINVRAFDSAYNPYSTGNITKVNPSDVLNGRDIGTFDKISSPLVNGVASFSYTAPDKLEADTSTLTFAFYHDSDPSKIQLYTMSIVPDDNQVVLTSYELKTSTPDDVNMNLESTKTFSYSVYNKNGTVLPDNQIKSLTVTSLNPSLAVLEDNTGKSGTSLSTTKQNGFTVNVTSNKKSGLIPIKVDAVFNDENGDEQKLTKIFNTVVFSGPPTAASLGYVSTSFDDNKGLYTEKWRLMLTDKYSNLVNTKPSISSSMLVGYAESSAQTANVANYLFYDANGSMAANGTKGKFTALSGVFDNIDLVNDALVVFGQGYKFSTFGKWEIDTKTSSVLNLKDDFSGLATDHLNFAVGHNLRNERCNGDATVAKVNALNGDTTLGEDGVLILEITYSDYMVGKSLVLSTNFLGGYNNLSGQLGYAKKITLVGTGLVTEIYNVKKGASTGRHILHVYVKDSPHGRTYQNANFAYVVDLTARDTSISVTNTSMFGKGIMDCSSGGSAYVEVTINGVAGGDGTLKLINLRVADEF